MTNKEEKFSLSDVAIDIIDGDRGVNYPNSGEFSSAGYCLFLNAGNVTSGGFLFSDRMFISREKDRSLRKGKLIRGDVVLTTRGTVGNVAYYDSSIPFEHIRINSGMVIFRANEKFIDSRYLYLFLRSAAFRAQVSALQTGSAQPQLPIRDIRKIKVRVPSIVEQKKIASILGSIDDLIETNRRTNETLEAMTRAIFKDWFVNFGPVRAKAEGRAPYLAPEIWSLFPDTLDDEDKPKGWRIGNLGDVACSVGQVVNPDNLSADTPYIGLEHMPRKSIALDSWEGAGKVSSGKLRFKNGDFLFGKLRPYFHKVGVVPIDGICSTDIVVIRERIRSASGFVLSTISSSDFVEYTDRTSGGTKMPRTSWDIMAKYEMIIPPTDVLESFESLAKPMFDQIKHNIHEFRSLAQTRDFLLPKLMSGEIRVKDAEHLIQQAV